MEKQSPGSDQTFLGILLSPMAQPGAVLRLNWLVPSQGKDSSLSSITTPHSWLGSRAM